VLIEGDVEALKEVLEEYLNYYHCTSTRLPLPFWVRSLVLRLACMCESSLVPRLDPLGGFGLGTGLV